MSSKMDHVGSKTRSLGQILEKPCVTPEATFSVLTLMKPGHNVCLQRISDMFENGSCQVKTRSLGQIL